LKGSYRKLTHLWHKQLFFC